MQQDLNFKVQELSKVRQLLDYIERSTVDSEHGLIRAEEVSDVANLVIDQLIFKHPHLDQILQELLDELRFGI